MRAASAQEPGQPTKFTARDQMLGKREEKGFVDEGYKNFHNAKALGGTIGISCDMCHPDASDTHPESYPKFQTQPKKTALLRDMINRCIENPPRDRKGGRGRMERGARLAFLRLPRRHLDEDGQRVGLGARSGAPIGIEAAREPAESFRAEHAPKRARKQRHARSVVDEESLEIAAQDRKSVV